MSETIVVVNETTSVPVLVSGAADIAGPTGPTGPSNEIATRSDLAALTSPAAGAERYLTESGREGIFVFESSNHSAHVTADTNQGIYVPPASAPTGASGAWVRKFTEAHIDWFGAVGDDATNDGPAFASAIATLKAASQSYSDSLYKGSGRLRIGAKKYYLASTTLDLTHTLLIEGEGTGQDGGLPSRLRWAAGTTGIRIQRYNTSGATTTDGVTHLGGDGSIIRGLFLEGGYSGTEGEYHGIQMRARATVEDCFIYHFQGDGIHIDASAGGGSNEGNANVFILNRVSVNGNRDGIYCSGADVNAGLGIMINAMGNRRWGINDSSFLGNTWIAPHTSDNGLVSGATPTVVSNGTYRYTVKAGQATGAATNAPSGTTADNTWWLYNGAGGASPANNIPTWANPTTVREGGAFYAANATARNMWLAPYCEGGQGIAQTWGSGGMVVGGSAGTVSGLWMRSVNGVATLDALASSTTFSTGGQASFGGDIISTAGGRIKQFHSGGVKYYDQMWIGNNIYTVSYDGVSAYTAVVHRHPSTWQPDGSNTAVSIDTTGLAVSAGSLGYATGAGGAVTQATSRTTAVTINKACGAITLVSAAGSTAFQSFTVNNSVVAATDVIRVVQKSGTDKYAIWVTNVGAGSFQITFATLSGTTTEQPVFNFAVVKAVAA